VQIYSLTSGSWRTGPPTLRGVYGASAAYLANRLMVTGGRAAPGGALDLGNTLYQTQTMQVLVGGNQWFSGLAEPVPAAGMASAIVGTTWYLTGGDTTPSGPTAAALDVVQAYSPSSGWVLSNTHPVFTSETVRNAASLGVGPSQLSPGSLASIIGNNLANVTVTAAPVRFANGYFTTDLPDALGGIRVSIDNVTAGIVMVSPQRIDFQVPFSLPANPTPREATLAVFSASSPFQAAPVKVSVVDAAPGIFTYAHGETAAINYLDQNAGIAYNSNGTLNYGSQPAHPGELITLRTTGLGDVQPRPDSLQRPSRDTLTTALKLPAVLIDGKNAEVTEVRLLPGEVGVYEVQVRIPSDAHSGVRVPVVVTSGGIQSNTAILAIE
jgi:uncharacterized protein (TIGR03437 family)